MLTQRGGDRQGQGRDRPGGVDAGSVARARPHRPRGEAGQRGGHQKSHEPPPGIGLEPSDPRVADGERQHGDGGDERRPARRLGSARLYPQADPRAGEDEGERGGEQRAAAIVHRRAQERPTEVARDRGAEPAPQPQGG